VESSSGTPIIVCRITIVTVRLTRIVYLQVLRAEKRILDDEGLEYKYFYHVHYTGKSKVYDCWMEEDDLYKYNVELLEGVESVVSEEARARAWKAVEEKKARLRLIQIPEQLRLRIPPSLKNIILEDYRQTVQHGRILGIPRSEGKPSVAQIVGDWKNKTLNKDDVVDDEDIHAIETTADNLIDYFNYSLRPFLLYHNEVSLCDRVVVGDTAPASLYGAEHLLRLLVKLPELVCVATMALPENAKYIVTVEDLLQDLMKYMTDDRNSARLFAAPEDYKPAYTYCK